LRPERRFRTLVFRYKRGMFMSGRRKVGPLGFALAGYGVWRRLSPRQRQAVWSRISGAAAGLRSRGARPS
jgi:hypothetical protein